MSLKHAAGLLVVAHEYERQLISHLNHADYRYIVYVGVDLALPMHI